MEYMELGRTGERIPKLGIGTWKMPNDSKECISAIRTAISSGMTLVDTAEMYANEEMVGSAIHGSEAFVVTKVSPHHFHAHDVAKACDASLKRLGIKSIDLYLLHWPNASIPISETMRAMEDLVRAGKVRHIGVSNFSVEEMLEAQAALKREEIAANQVEYSAYVRSIEKGMLEFCQRERITVMAYSPLARGSIPNAAKRRVQEVLDRLALAHKKTPVQVALNYLISHKGVMAIPKAASRAHVLEDAGAAGWHLSPKEMLEIGSLGGQQSPMVHGAVKWLAKNMSAWSSVMEKIEKVRHAAPNRRSPGKD